MEQLISDSTAEVGLVFSFDGASRGNPGDASYGSCGWWGTWDTQGFNDCGVLFQHGRRLGTQTNNVGEARGLAFAAKAMLHWHFWFVEECARIAASEVQEA